MADTNTSGVSKDEAQALEGISVAPPEPADANTSTVKTGRDDVDEKLDHDLEETFPGSDAPSSTRPGSSGEPAPSSGYDPAAEPG